MTVRFRFLYCRRSWRWPDTPGVRHYSWRDGASTCRGPTWGSCCASPTGRRLGSTARQSSTGRPDRAVRPRRRLPAPRRPRGVGSRPVPAGEPAQHSPVRGFPGVRIEAVEANDSREMYRGVYEWDRPMLAENYARALWRVLALVSVSGSIGYRVLPSLRRDEVLRSPRAVLGDGTGEWWRLTDAETRVG